MTPNTSVDDRTAALVDVLVSPRAYPHVLRTNRPLGLREDHKEAYQTLLSGLRDGTVGTDDVRAWFLSAARAGAITRLPSSGSSGSFVFPLLLTLRFASITTLGAHEFRSVSFDVDADPPVGPSEPQA